MIRVWYKWGGQEVDSCLVKAATKAEARSIMEEVLPSAKIGAMEKVQEEE